MKKIWSYIMNILVLIVVNLILLKFVGNIHCMYLIIIDIFVCTGIGYVKKQIIKENSYE